MFYMQCKICSAQTKKIPNSHKDMECVLKLLKQAGKIRLA